MTFLSTASVIFAGLLALVAAYVYFIGVPPDLKRKMEEQALKTMGENKASYLVKDQISKMPEGDQKELRDFKNTLSNVAGGAVQNPLGKFAGDMADDVSAPMTGR